MRKLSCLLLITLLSIQTAAAQDAATCSPADLNQQVDSLYETYLSDREADAAGAIVTLQTALDDLMAACENVTPEAVVETGLTSETDSASPVRAGHWRVLWNFNLADSCQNSAFSGSVDRNFLMIVDAANDEFTAVDNAWWPQMTFYRTEDGDYLATRNEFAGGGNTNTYEYLVTVSDTGQLDGAVTAFLSGANCVAQATFEMQAVNETIICMVNTSRAANLRGGPGTDYEVTGGIPRYDLQPVIGQAEGSDGFIWWQSTPERWVRSDLVEAVGDCESVPVVASE